MSDLTQSAEWRALQDHQRQMANTHLNDLFAGDLARFDRMHVRLGPILFDYSKNRVTHETLRLLVELARARGVEPWRARMLAGDRINHTENRAALHTALRYPDESGVLLDGRDVMPDIRQTLARMREISTAVRAKKWKGFSGKAVTTIVNIGIGGSHLGPAMVARALAGHKDKPKVMFVSNVDAEDLHRTLDRLAPETTLFLLNSKTFSTQETMANAQMARDWVLAAARDDAALNRHFIALTGNPRAAQGFGLASEQILTYPEWVGGRFSLWGPAGLAIMMAAGADAFDEMLSGAHQADRHFQTTPLEANIPVLMALLGVWNRNFLSARVHAILPYDQRLALFPSYLQQLEMESNGKRVDRSGREVDYMTAPVLFGEAGTNGQHSFYQLIHQGTHTVPCDFIAAAAPDHPFPTHHRQLLANAMAQARALMTGQDLVAAEGDIYHSFPGNIPSNFFLLDRLTPAALGMLCAFYEHKVFAQGIIWNINSFDQPGVTLGKKIANQLLTGETENGTLDSSTLGLLAALGTHGVF